MKKRPRVTSVFGMTVSILVFAVVSAAQTIYDNGPISTGPTARNSTVAPAGFTWSEASFDFGSTTVANTNAGFGCQVIGVATANRCADDFNVPVGQTWTITQVIIFAYQTGSVANPFVGANLRIWSGRPGDVGSTIVFGDTATNRMGTSTDTTVYRIFNSGPPGNTATGTTRLIRQVPINVSPSAVLTAGNYWVDFQLDAGASGNFSPAAAITGIRGATGWNARQFIGPPTNTGWAAAFDAGTPATADDIAQDFPFKLVGSISGAPLAPSSRSIDFNGDNKTDFAVARSASAGGQTTWWIRNSAGQDSASDWGLGVGFATGDRATPADFDGDGKTDIAVWRPGAALTAAFYILNSAGNTVSVVQFGQTGDDVTVVDDYDGDGKADPACYRAGASGTFFYRGSLGNPGGNITYALWGTTGDSAIPGDYDGDGKADFTIFRNDAGQAQHWRRQSDGSVVVLPYGLFTDKFVTGDFDGDGKTDIAAIRTNGANYDWYILRSSTGVTVFEKFGLSATDYPVPGDYDGDNETDIAVWRSGQAADQTYFFVRNTNNSPVVQEWGQSAGTNTAPDYPVANWNVK
ncbi:MAG: FG-GAP repeat domain-containing protein [Pyrinomonadaceae bacterium]